MAINVTQSPSSRVSANDPLIWKFQFSALGTGSQVKRMLYYLADSANNALSDTYVWTPKAATEVLTLDAKELVSGLVSTAWPTASGTATTDSGCVYTVKIRYSEATFDTSSCTDSVGSYASTSTTDVWNTSLDIDTAATLTWTGGKTGYLMNSYPSYMEWSSDAEPYIWYGGTGTVKFTFYNAAGTPTEVTTTMSGSTSAKYLCADWRLHGITSAPVTLKIDISDGTGTTTKWAKYSVCSCRDFYTCLNFLDPLGGRSSVSLICPSEININREIKEVFSYNPTQTTGGRSVSQPKATETIKVATVLSNDFDGLKYARALFGSPGHHIMRMSSSGNKTWYKFILTGGSAKVIEGKKNLQVELSGYIADEKNGQPSDI